MQTVQDDNFLISMLATKKDNGIQFSASITNFTEENYFFDENCVSVYQGVYENDSWSKIKYEPASIYFIKEKQALQAEAIATGVLMGMSAANTGYSTVSGSGYVGGTRYTYKANVYSSADAALAMTNSYIVLDNMQQRNQNYLEFLENNLLYSSELASKENYNGIFVVDEKKGPDYKVVLELSPTEQFVFYFTRSDKDEILNPWKDKSHSRHSFVAGISPLLNHGSAYWLWSRARWFGFYSGIVFQYESSDIEVLDYVSSYELSELRYLHVDGLNSSYDWKFDYDESTIKSDSFGFYSGVTLKTFPYTWLLLGCGFDFVSNECFEGDLYYRCSSNNENYKKYGRCCLAVDYDIFVTPQVGVNFITNHLDIGAMTYFSYGDYAKGKFNIDILLGIAL